MKRVHHANDSVLRRATRAARRLIRIAATRGFHKLGRNTTDGQKRTTIGAGRLFVAVLDALSAGRRCDQYEGIDSKRTEILSDTLTYTDATQYLPTAVF